MLQTGFTVLLIVLTGVGFDYFYKDLSSALIEEVIESLQSSPSMERAGVIAAELEYVKTRALILAIAAVLSVAAVFGYGVARLTLAPTRKALSSQKRFIGDLAHEIRTPVTILKTNMEVALLEEGLPSSQRKAIRSNIEELDRIADLINNLLSLNALFRPERMEFKDIDFGEVVDDALSKLSEFAEHKNLHITKRKSTTRMVRGNATALGQVAMNVLKNAMWYTPENGQIDIAVIPDYQGFIELTVRDSGIGIARDDLFHIFEPFYRAERSRARHSGGSGLGLAIVNDIVKLHNGKIAIKSAPKKGTTIMISIPCGSPGSEADTPKKPKGEVAVDFSNKQNETV